MPNTYSQLHVQIVFSVKERQSLVKESRLKSTSAELSIIIIVSLWQSIAIPTIFIC